MDLFEQRRRSDTAARAPLADRMRPRTMEEFVGQEHIVGPGRLLRRAIEADQLSSLIFYGPPGTGKTTLARIIANTTEAHFIALNAVLAGVNDIRSAVKEANDRRGMYGQRTILFVDEVHRFNKAQQDALLPWVENGTVIFIGATTENPYFEVNKALVSRSRIFQLRRLDPSALGAIAEMALRDPDRGYGDRAVAIDEDALDHLIDVAGGDARGVLNALELAVETTPADESGTVHIDLAVAEESIQRRAVLYDKEGDVHYDTTSAFIKSLRGSDPDAALYWLARMVYAGEDPRYLFRRMLILAAEDVGLADPRAIRVVTGCAQAFDYVGMPEGQFHLAMAAIYLATAPKSNSCFAYHDALAVVEREEAPDVPTHLKDASRDGEGFGHGAGYLYPHAYRDHWVAQQYLPPGLQGRLFYEPSAIGFEGRLRARLARHREAQLEAAIELDASASDEIMTYAGATVSRQRDRWLARATGRAGRQLEAIRDRVIGSAGLQRTDRVIDLRAGAGLLTWEALRRCAEGGVWALAADEATASMLESRAGALPAAERPVVLVGQIAELPMLLDLRGESDVRFDAALGRNALGALDAEAMVKAAGTVAALMAPSARLCLVEAVHARGSRPSELLRATALDADLRQRLATAEAHHASRDPRFAWLPSDLATRIASAGLEGVECAEELVATQIVPTAELVARWLAPGGGLGGEVQALFVSEEVEQLRSAFIDLARTGAVPWTTVRLFVTARKSAG